MAQAAVEPSKVTAQATAPPPKSSPRYLALLQLVFALAAVTQLHVSLPWSIPRIQAIAYPAEPGQDLVYGLRVTLPLARNKWANDRTPPKEWSFELGKVPDDGLKTRVESSYVGLSDNWCTLLRCEPLPE